MSIKMASSNRLSQDFSSEELQRAIQDSIRGLTFEEQLKMAEEQSREEQRIKELSYEEEVKKATEVSRKSFFQKHFPYDPVAISKEQTDLAKKRLNAEHRKPFERDVRTAIELSQNEQSGSDSDSGFASEDRELELALLRSQDPSEQESQEERDLLLAIKLSQNENSSVEFSSEANYNSSSQESDHDLWFYDHRQGFSNSVQGFNPNSGSGLNPSQSQGFANSVPGFNLSQAHGFANSVSGLNPSQAQGFANSVSGLNPYQAQGSNPKPNQGLVKPLSAVELNDQILLQQIETSYNPLTPEELEALKPFLEDDDYLEQPVNPVKPVKPVNPEVKSLDEIEAEFNRSVNIEISKKNKKKRRNRNSASSSPSLSSGFGSPRDTETETHNRNTGARPKSTNPNFALPTRNSPDFFNSQRQSPDVFSYTNAAKKNNSGYSGHSGYPGFTGAAVSGYSGHTGYPGFTGPSISGKSGNAGSSISGKSCLSGPSISGNAGSGFRPIIVDGCNVSYQHGKNDRFSAKGMQIVYDYFTERFGYSNENIFIVYRDGGRKSQADLDMIESLYKIDVLVKTVN